MLEAKLLCRLGVLASWCVGGVLGLALSSRGGLARWLSLRRSPEGLHAWSVCVKLSNEICVTYQVVTEKLHDESGVLVAFLGESVEL